MMFPYTDESDAPSRRSPFVCAFCRPAEADRALGNTNSCYVLGGISRSTQGIKITDGPQKKFHWESGYRKPRIWLNLAGNRFISRVVGQPSEPRLPQQRIERSQDRFRSLIGLSV